ncbi:hypothetical protein GGTG_07992 [Gaeumannomyces tritici R3-111a-1]|uniref:Ubiquitin-related modifier 1 n=1 Tax=Gaeumannomyces tritici (strain R3-111a-1) TaxID=644352 RepID=J3P3A4_GAET3|nr:hypothetical protein GGTG_07992 [Gaeumannomyces tritici R3-111a-1]EJT74146.1 hypothetical protein GGTG_07992 [Gaeumannomyces tritici R3-111a-1]
MSPDAAASSTVSQAVVPPPTAHPAATAAAAAAAATPPSEKQHAPTLGIVVEFSGGLEMLFSHQVRHQLALPNADDQGSPATIAFLIGYLCRHAMKDARRHLFVLDGHLRPGILVLINDADWELEGEEEYVIQPGDNILFVSTLHGG